jgi:carboxypeptidase family protein
VILGARLIGLIVIAELMVACGSQHPSARPATSAVTGMVAAGPVSPVARPGQPATHPVRGAIVEALRGGHVVAVTHTDNAGRYELSLPPGTYVILVKDERYFSMRKSENVALSAGDTTRVVFVLDTGIR